MTEDVIGTIFPLLLIDIFHTHFKLGEPSLEFLDFVQTFPVAFRGQNGQI